MSKNKLFIIIILALTIATCFLGLDNYIGFLPILIANGFITLYDNYNLKKLLLYKIAVIIMLITVLLQICDLMFNINDRIGIICLLCNLIISIILSDHNYIKKAKKSEPTHNVAGINNKNV